MAATASPLRDDCDLGGEQGRLGAVMLPVGGFSLGPSDVHGALVLLTGFCVWGFYHPVHVLPPAVQIFQCSLRKAGSPETKGKIAKGHEPPWCAVGLSVVEDGEDAGGEDHGHGRPETSFSGSSWMLAPFGWGIELSVSGWRFCFGGWGSGHLLYGALPVAGFAGMCFGPLPGVARFCGASGRVAFSRPSRRPRIFKVFLEGCIFRGRPGSCRFRVLPGGLRISRSGGNPPIFTICGAPPVFAAVRGSAVFRVLLGGLHFSRSAWRAAFFAFWREPVRLLRVGLHFSRSAWRAAFFAAVRDVVWRCSGFSSVLWCARMALTQPSGFRLAAPAWLRLVLPPGPRRVPRFSLARLGVGAVAFGMADSWRGVFCAAAGRFFIFRSCRVRRVFPGGGRFLGPVVKRPGFRPCRELRFFPPVS